MQSSTDEKNGTFNVPEEEAPPPQFSEEWTRPTSDGQDRPVEGTSSGHADFPSVGEMPIPNVSPMTAHVFVSLKDMLIEVPSCCSETVCRVVSRCGIKGDGRGYEIKVVATVSCVCRSTVYSLSLSLGRVCVWIQR